MSEPLISVVIPTRNRQRYCIAAIEDILSYDYPSMELCIHDNSDDDTIARHIEQRPFDPRLKYIYVPERLNSVFNMDRAIGMATGKYITMIGDDDTILPGLLDVLEWMEREGIDSVAPKEIVAYYWPQAHRSRTDGLLFIPHFCGERQPIDARQKVTQLFRNGIVRYQKYQLPRVYHGIVLMEHMKTIRHCTGHYFGGLSPDIYSTVALSEIVKNHYVIDIPMSIAGACTESSSSLAPKGQHQGELNSAPHLHLRGEYAWDTAIPAYYSVSTIWAESALKSVEEMKITELREQFNYYRFVAYATLFDMNMKMFAWRKLWTHPDIRTRLDRMLAAAILLCKFISIELWKRSIGKLFLKKKVISIEGISDIAQASRIVKTHIHNHCLSTEG